MQFYLATSFIFPRSLRFRLFTLCFLTTHLPLLGYIVWGAATGRTAWAEFIVLALATMPGAAGALIAIGAFLAPIHAWADAPARANQSAPKARGPTLPDGGHVIPGLFHGVADAAVATRRRHTQRK